MTFPPAVSPHPSGENDETSVLEWLRVIADQNVPDALSQTATPVAWLGRTSTDDAQDPTLSLPRQLESSRNALPLGFVIVAKFYDVESGRKAVEQRGTSNAHSQFDIPIPRDGGIADLLAEAQRPDRRFVAVVCESIERVARTTYFSTKIEHELEQAGVALLAADEGIDASAIPSLNSGSAPFRRATPTLTRRVKQAISEWYVLNMLELSWGGTKAHTNQGFNIGKPPYGYAATKMRHPVKNKAEQGKTKHRLVPDPVRGPVVTRIFLWRALDRIGYQAIANRLNADLERYPPPDPIIGDGPRHRVGAWTASNVREVLDNPKHTGYMVWNRRKRSRPERGIRGKVNPPTAWVWSALPTHEPLVTREIFEAAGTIGGFRQGSRSDPGRSPIAKRTYLLRSYLRHASCDRRMWGHSVRKCTYYRCVPDKRHHAHRPWFDAHPSNVIVREEEIVAPLNRFFEQRIFGEGRALFLAQEADEPGADGPTVNDTLAERQATLIAEITNLQQRQIKLIAELERFEPSGDDDFDQAWRSGIQDRFRGVLAEQKARKSELTEVQHEERKAVEVDPALLESLPFTSIKISRLPEDRQRRLFDAFHLELRYHDDIGQLDIQVTLTGDTAADLGAAVRVALGQPEDGESGVGNALGARGGSRTRTPL
jgi:site-specific DNA recombinase